MLKWQKEHAVPVSASTKDQKLENGKFLLGILYQGERQEYSEKYQELIQKVSARSVES